MINRVVIFLVLCVFMDVLVGLIGQRFVKDLDSGFFGNVNNAINDKSDILILGSSKAQNHYNTALISKHTGLSSYNGGMAGFSVLSSYAIFKERIQRHKPKLVVLDIGAGLLSDSDQLMKLKRFSPFYGIYPSFDEILKFSPTFNYTKYCKSLRYNSSLYDLIFGVTSKSPKDNFTTSKQKMRKVPKYDKGEYKYDIVALHLFYIQKISKICKDSGIEFVYCLSPSFHVIKQNKHINQLHSETLSFFESNEIRYIDVFFDSEFSKKQKLFKDINHLNTDGSTEFSEYIAKEFRSILSINVE